MRRVAVAVLAPGEALMRLRVKFLYASIIKPFLETRKGFFISFG
jgi:hypothetical protein